MAQLSTFSAVQHVGPSAKVVLDTSIEPETLDRPVNEWAQASPPAETVAQMSDHADATKIPPTSTERRLDVPRFSDLKRLLNFPRAIEKQEQLTTLHALQEWEGYVIAIGESDFTARLLDLTARSSVEEEEATIPLDEIADIDSKRMREGSIFRWVIGYERSPAGTKKRVSQIVFRDLPAVTQSDLGAGAAWAQGVVDALKL